MILKGFEKYILVIVFFSSVGKVFDGNFSHKVNNKIQVPVDTR